ncbi:MAG: methyltransferase domain-containing protein [Acidimicrobiia bacterium]|nr:methyltransferase domain-containing protein [Acidimicrobiia bacterium]
MSEFEKIKWDERYSSSDYRPRDVPSPFLESSAPLIPVGRALVLAAGTGRNALWLAEHGFYVDAVDISAVAVAKGKEAAEARGLSVRWIAADLDEFEINPGTYGLVTMVRYVNRALWRNVVSALTPDGWLLMEQHLRTYLDVDGPPGDEFRVAPGELLTSFADLRIVRYVEGLAASREPGRHVALAMLLACRGNPGW